MFERKPLRSIKWCPLLVLLLLSAQSVGAEQLRVSRFFFGFVSGQIQVSCQIDYELDEKIILALENGIVMHFQTTFELLRKRNFFPDKVIISSSHNFDIKYYALLKQFIVRESHLRAERSFVSLRAALAFMGKADKLSLGYQSSITEDGDYYLQARARLLNDELPLPLRVQSYFTKDWRPVSNWRVIEVIKDGA